MLSIGISCNAVWGSVGVAAGVELNNASSPRPRRLGSFSGGIVFSLGILFHQFSRNAHIGFRSNGADVVQNDRLPEARCFREPNISRDHVSEDFGAEIIP